jgi:hypothetical protein
MNHVEFLKSLGRPKDAAAAFGVRTMDICHWRERGIPSRRWLDAERIARERGLPVTAADFAKGLPPAPRQAAE